MPDITCIGFALGFAYLRCKTLPVAPTGKASFCAVMNQRGGKLRPSRKDTAQSISNANEINAAYDAICAKKGTK